MALSLPGKYAAVNEHLDGELDDILRELDAKRPRLSNADIVRVLRDRYKITEDLSPETIRRWRQRLDGAA